VWHHSSLSCNQANNFILVICLMSIGKLKIGSWANDLTAPHCVWVANSCLQHLRAGSVFGLAMFCCLSFDVKNENQNNHSRKGI
jgi:hypothetical protein